MKKLRRIMAFMLAVIMVVGSMTNVFARSEKKYEEDGAYYAISLAVVTSDGYSIDKIDGVQYKDSKSQSKWKNIVLGFYKNHLAIDETYGTQYIINNKTKETTMYKVQGTLTNGEAFEVIIENVDNYQGSGLSFYEYCERTYNNSFWDGKTFNVVYVIDTKCDVTYDVDGVKANDVAAKGKEYQIKSEEPTKDGYEFVGWMCDGKLYQAGQTIKVEKEKLEFKAQWDAVEYKVTYNANGGEGAPTDEAVYVIGDKVVVSDVVPAKNKAVFKGWSYDGVVYTAGKEVTVNTSDIEFTAVWNPIYTITYTVDGEVVATKDVEAGTDVSGLLTYEYTALPESKNLSAWSVVTDANVAAINKDITVAATTSTKTFTVVYNLNGEEYKKIENVEYGTSLDLVESPAKESEDFSGWKVISGDIANVTEDVVIEGTTQIKKFTVTYKVDGEIVKTFENVEYDSNLPVYEYVAAEGYDFSGFGVMPATVQQNLVFEGTTQIKTFTVTFVNENGNVITSVEYNYGEQVVKPADPKKSDVKIENGTDAAKWSRFAFAGWVAEGDYTVDDMNKVTEDMTFKAKFTESQIKVYFHILNRDMPQAEEPASHSSKDYSKSVEGSLKTFAEINNNDEAVANAIFAAPSAEDFGITLNDGESIKWYVIKKINADKWHVDGIIVGQKYDVVVNYVDEAGNTLADSKTVSVAATEEYNVESPEIKGYELVDANEANVTGVMPYETVEVTVEYKKTEYNVTYVDALGVEVPVDEATYTMGDTVVVKADLENDGYRFDGWSYNGVTYKAGDEIKMDAENIVLTSNWTKLYTVTYKVNDEVVAQFVVEEGTDVSDYASYVYADLKVSENITAWAVETEDVALTAIDKDMVVVAETSVKTYKVLYYLNGVRYNEEDIIVNYGESIELLGSPADEKSEDFAGWEVINGDISNITEDIIIEGKTSLKKFVVTYFVDGNEVAVFEELVYGDEVPTFEYVVAEGYDFSGWDNVPTEVTESIVINGTTQIKTFTVTYKVDGEVVDEFTVEYGSEVPASTYEVPEGYEFTGFELVTEVEGEMLVKQDMVFEGTTSEIVVEEEEEEEDIDIDTPFAPGTSEEDNNDADNNDANEDAADNTEADNNVNDNNVSKDENKDDDASNKSEDTNTDVATDDDADVEEEEEDISLDTPFDSGVKTGDESNYTGYIAVLLIAAVGAMIVAYNKKRALN